MNSWVKWMLVALSLLIAPMQGAAQVDICYDFNNQVWPSGWVVHHTDGGSILQQAAVYAHSFRFSTRLCDSYLVLPYIGADFSDSLAIQFYAKNAAILEVGTMPNMQDWQSFSPISEFEDYGDNWHRYIVDLSSANPSHRHICFHVKKSSTDCYIDNLSISSSLGFAGNFRIEHAVCDISANLNNSWAWSIYNGECNGDTVHLAWDTYANQPFSITVTTNLEDTLYNNPSQTGNSLDLYLPPGYYNFRWSGFSGAANACIMTDTESVIVTVSNIPCDSTPCVNLASLFSNKCTPYYGTYAKPYQHVGYITTSNNPQDPTSRHLICHNTPMTDPIVAASGSHLYIVPPGESYSIRLGNWQTGAQAEAMEYNIDVDTTDFDMLILKYAAVMQDPDHDSSSQPRFRIEMLDADGKLIEPAACNSYDFVSSSELGWRSFIWVGTTVLWKDWTIVGINLSDYHGQSVRLRLTTYDCSAGAHFGYAYYNISCAKKTLQFSSCSESDSNIISAPEGFNYRWYRDDNNATISTERTARIPVDGHYYYCDMGFIGDPTCSVTLNVLSRLVWPEADFSYTVTRENCRFRVDFQDHSHHVGDTVTTCESVRWNFGPHGTSTLRYPTVYYYDTGTYTVMLIASMPGGDCNDTAFATLHLTLPFDTIDTAICENQSLLLYDSLYSTAGIYTLHQNCDTIQLLKLILLDTAIIDTMATTCEHLNYRGEWFLTDTVCDFTYTNMAGCDSIHRLHLTINPKHETTDSIIVCPNQPWRFMENGMTPPCSFDTMLHNQFGCDSLVHVTLTPRDTGYRLYPIYRLDSAVWHPADTILFGCAPDTLFLRDTTPSSMTWLWTLTANDDTLTSTTNEAMLPLPTYAETASFQLIAQSAIDGCMDTVGYPIYIFRTPLAEFDWQYTGGPGINPPIERPEVQFTNRSEPIDSLDYLWRIPTQAGSLDYYTTTEVNPFYHWGQPGDYMQGDYEVQLIAYWFQTAADTTIQHTCIDTAFHPVTITNDYLQFPNLVTPNGDNTNDFWKVVNLVEYSNYPINELWIYNQWGAEVFHVSNIRTDADFWYPNITNSPDGTYYYRFLAQGPYGVVKHTGIIEVLRELKK